MNEVTEEQSGLATRLSKIAEISKLLSNEETEWKAIVILQNSLDANECSRYMNLIANMAKNMGNATIEDRIDAYNQTKLK